MQSVSLYVHTLDEHQTVVCVYIYIYIVAYRPVAEQGLRDKQIYNNRY
jgi:hypothetical protein